MKTVAIIVAGLFLLASCAAQKVTPTTVHLRASKSDPEHDETVSLEGVYYFYPNRSAPHEIVYLPKDGGVIGLTCLDSACSQMSAKSHGSKAYPEGSFQIVKTDGPDVMMIRDFQGANVVGFASRNHGGEWKVFPDLEQAQEFEHQGDTATKVVKTAGDVVLGVLMVGLLVAVVGAAALLNARAHPVYTK